jgi:hypothetical protein
MNLSRKIAAALEARPDPGALPADLSVDEGPHHLTLRLTAAGPVGLAFDALEFRTSARDEWTIEDQRAWGGRLAARLTYLMEPLSLLEADPAGGQVVLRSQAPTPRHGHHSYYEIRLGRPGTLHLGRVTFDEPTRRRQPTSCHMTREVLERLADDLVDTAS